TPRGQTVLAKALGEGGVQGHDAHRVSGLRRDDLARRPLHRLGDVDDALGQVDPPWSPDESQSFADAQAGLEQHLEEDAEVIAPGVPQDGLALVQGEDAWWTFHSTITGDDDATKGMIPILHQHSEGSQGLACSVGAMFGRYLVH